MKLPVPFYRGLAEHCVERSWQGPPLSHGNVEDVSLLCLLCVVGVALDRAFSQVSAFRRRVLAHSVVSSLHQGLPEALHCRRLCSAPPLLP